MSAAEVYPVRVDASLDAPLSRWLWLVKWWLLAIPQYIIVALFTGGGLWLGWRAGVSGGSWGGVGLIGVLALIAAVVLLVTGRYPPFRLDMGGHDPGTVILSPATEEPSAAPEPRGPTGTGGWTASRIVSVVAGAVLMLLSLGLLGGGGTALWAQTQRHGGYVDFGTASYSTAGYALTSDTIAMHMADSDWDAASALVGTVRIRVTPVGDSSPVFIGIASAGAADGYLTGVAYATVSGTTGHRGTYTEHAGSAPAITPAQAGIWTAQAAGPGTQTLTWALKSGDWMIVVMNADGSQPVSVQVNVAATLPALPWIATGLLIGGFACLIGGILLIAIPLRKMS